MKKVLLTSTALVMTAGVAAAEMSMSASAKLTYGNFGTGHNRAGDTSVRTVPSGAAVPDAAWNSEADLDIAGSGGGGTITYSATLELDEAGEDAGAFTISSGGFSFTYDENDVGGLESTGADGEDDNTGDYSVSYTAGGLTAKYVRDATSEDTNITLGYAMGDLTLGLEVDENNNALSGDATNTTSVGYKTGDYTISLEADDADDWDASLAYTTGGTTVTLATDEESVMSVKIAYAAGDMSVSARQEFGGNTPADEETEFNVSYTSGDLTFGAKYDSGDDGDYGDEAATVINIGYALDGATIAAKANDQDEMEVSVSFAF